MLLIDDLAIVLIIKGLFTELSADLFHDLFDQPVPDRAVAVDIVRRPNTIRLAASLMFAV